MYKWIKGKYVKDGEDKPTDKSDKRDKPDGDTADKPDAKK